MAVNLNRTFGFRPLRYLDSAPYMGTHTSYATSASDGTAIYVGDLVKFDTSNRSTALTDAFLGGVPLVSQSGGTITTTVYRGVVVGFVPQPEFVNTATASLGTMYRLASTARYVYLVDDAQVIFEGQETGTNSYTSASANAINKLMDVLVGSGNTTTGLSGFTLDGANVGTTNKPMRIMRATQRIDNFISATSPTQVNPFWHWDFVMANCDLAAAVMTGA